ncbi:RHS repeat-associated protein [Chryseobacterium sp. CBTAP 102]|nr:RHS repeat-associated protein [Chryseobacterium sp. CBTAP 102]
MYDYGARMLMPDLGRWGAMDAMSEKYSAWSPYNYAINNPVMVIDPDGNDISYSGEMAQQAFKAYVGTMSTSTESSGGNIFTGFASNLFGDDYILNRNGKFERISETKYSFDRLYNWDKSKVIKLNKEFMKNLRQDMKYDSYSNQYKPTETTITFENSSVSTKQIKNYFYFLAANTEKKWGFNHLTKNGWFSDSSVTIINSNHQDDEVSLSPIFKYLDSGYDLIGSGHSHQMLIYDHPENKHLLKGRYEAINYPSGFNSDGSVRYEINKGDRASHETLLQNYGNQVKAYPWIYIGNKDNRPHFIYYDTTSFRRK